MRVSQSGKQLFRDWEGLSTNVYLDSGGYPTIGIGHLLTRDERSSGKILIDGQYIKYRDGLTEQQCWSLLDEDLVIAEYAVNCFVYVPINQNQFDALVSFAFNVRIAAFKRSTLVKLLNNMQYDLVPVQLRRWIHSNGTVVNGLINRRDKEIELWSRDT